MAAGELIPRPLELRRAEAVDPFALEAGAMIGGRFCVLGPVAHARETWVAPVTDVQRALGEAPHHRLSLHFLPVDVGVQRVQRAVAADARLQPAVIALFRLGDGLAVLAEERPGVRPLAVGTRVSLPLGEALAQLLARLHAVGVEGVRFDLGQLGRGGVEHVLMNFAHLLGDGSARSDLAELRRLLAAHGDEALRAALAEPGAIPGLGEPQVGAPAADPQRWSAVLPAEPPFVGRRAILGELRAAARRARTARAAVLVVTGARGLGKSWLLRQLLLEAAQGEELLVLRAVHIAAGGLPRGGLAAALAELPRALQSLDAADREALVRRLRRAAGALSEVLCRLTPALSELLGASPSAWPPGALGDDLARHAGAVAAALAALGTARRPLLLCLDNLEAADRGSLAVLSHLAGMPAHHTLVVCAARGDALPEALAKNAERVELEPLSRDELGQLVSRCLPGPVESAVEIARALDAATGGVPLAAWTTLQHWIDAGRLARDRRTENWSLGASAASPSSVVELFDRRFARADKDQRWVAELVALGGEPAPPRWLASLSGWPQPRLDAAIDGLLRGGLWSVDDAGLLRFAHDAAREVVHHGTQPDHRRAHARLAAWLAAQRPPAAASQRAYHREHAAAPGRDEALARLHVEAGDELLRICDIDRAAWHFAHAEQRTADRALLGAAFAGRADAALRAGRVEEAVAAYHAAVETAEDPLWCARTAARAVYALSIGAAPGAAESLGRAALAAVGQPLPVRSGWSWLAVLGELLRGIVGRGPRRPPSMRDALCQLYSFLIPPMLVTDPPAVIIAALRSLRAARGLSTRGAAFALAFYGAGLACAGRLRKARRVFAHAADAARAADDRWCLGGIAHLRAQTLELPANEYVATQRLLDDATTDFRNTGDLSMASLACYFKALAGRDREPVSVLTGWLAEAELAADRQGSSCPQVGIDALRALLRVRQGRGSSRDLARLADELDQRSDAVAPEALVARAALIFALLALGDLAQALAAARRVYAVGRSASPVFVAEIHCAVAATLIAVGDGCTREDRQALRRALRELRRLGRWIPALAAARRLLRARLALAGGRAARARRLLSSVVARQVEHGQDYLVIEALQLLSRIGAGDDALQAAERLRQARQIACRLEVLLPDGIAQGSAGGGAVAAFAFPAVELPPPPRAVPAERAELSAVLFAARPTLAAALGGPEPQIDAEPDLRVAGPPVDVELLLVNLALTARVGQEGSGPPRMRARAVNLDETSAARLPSGRAGPHVCIELRLGRGSASAGAMAGLPACRRAAEQLGGFIDVGAGALGRVLAAYIPGGVEPTPGVAPRPRGCRRVGVAHGDPRVRETLVNALSRMGLRCAVGSAVALCRDPELELLFAEPRMAGESRAGLPCVTLLPHGASPGAAVSGPALRVPFALHELEALLAGLLPADGPDSEGGSR